jgi:hypothetical protein
MAAAKPAGVTEMSVAVPVVASVTVDSLEIPEEVVVAAGTEATASDNKLVMSTLTVEPSLILNDITLVVVSYALSPCRNLSEGIAEIAAFRPAGVTAVVASVPVVASVVVDSLTLPTTVVLAAGTRVLIAVVT